MLLRPPLAAVDYAILPQNVSGNGGKWINPPRANDRWVIFGDAAPRRGLGLRIGVFSPSSGIRYY